MCLAYNHLFTMFVGAAGIGVAGKSVIFTAASAPVAAAKKYFWG